MSSATSIDRAAGLKSRATGDGGQQDPRGARLESRDEDAGFNVGHFFVLMSLVAATVAVMMARPAAPEHLVLISLTIGGAGCAAFGVYRMLAPLAVTDSELASEPISARLRGDLEREKQLVLRSIKELEFDRAMGKVSPQDFEEMVGRLRARAIGIMKQLDQGGSAYRAVIEKELAARVGGRAEDRATKVARYTTAEETPAQAGSAQLQLRGVCTCGTTNDEDARFCKSCGRKLS